MDFRPHNRTLSIRLLQNFVGIAILAWFGYYLWVNRIRLFSVIDFSLRDTLLLASLILFSWLLNTAQGIILYRSINIRVGFFENFLIFMTATVGNYLPARVGTLLRARYLKANYDLSYARFGSIFAIRTVFAFIAAGTCGIVATLWLFTSEGRLSPELLCAFSLIAVLPILCLIWKSKRIIDNTSQHWIKSRFLDFLDGFHELRGKPDTAAAVVALFLIQYATLSMRFYFSARLLSDSITFPLALLLAPLSSLINFTSIIPGSLGIREGLMGYATYAAGFQFSLGLFIGLIDRAVLLTLEALIGGPSFAWTWLNMHKNSRDVDAIESFSK